MNVMQWVMENNLYKMLTGMDLNITYVRGLESAAPADRGRMIAYRNDPQVLRLHLPMPHRFFEPFQENWMTYLIPGAFRTAGLEIRLPGAIRYVDGIMPSAAEGENVITA